MSNPVPHPNPTRSALNPYVERLLSLGLSANKNDITTGIQDFLRGVHPEVGYRTEYPTGRRKRVDIVIGGVAVVIKARGEISESRDREQLADYLEGLCSKPRPDLGVGVRHKWKGILSDGKDWYFYDVKPKKKANVKPIDMADDPDGVVRMLGRFINKKILPTPPTGNPEWVKNLLAPFSALAEEVKSEPYFQVKQRLWSDVLSGTQVAPPADPDAETELFVRHAVLIVTARLVARTISPSQTDPAEGLADWVGRGVNNTVIDDLKEEMSRYQWDRDVLKNLYDAIIPSEFRCDFGVNYTPDWLATAVVEEVLDKEWVISMLTDAISEKHRKVQICDMSCGSGAFIYAAVKHLDALAAEVPDPDGLLRDESKTKILNDLVGGVDMHPVAVELAKVTKLLALGDKDIQEPLNIWMGDSLQWSEKTSRLFQGALIGVETSDGKTLFLPDSFVQDENYETKLGSQIFGTARNETGDEDSSIANRIASSESEREAVADTIKMLRDYLTAGRDGVWEWYLDNAVQPFRLSVNKPSRLVGNPPWMIYKHMSTRKRNEFSEHAKGKHVWADAQGLVAYNDLAALFVSTLVDLYLSDGDKFGFVLPYSALRMNQWAPFRECKWGADLYRAWNLRDVKAPPLKSASSCVMFGKRTTGTKKFGSWDEYSGRRISSRSSWEDVKIKLTSKPNTVYPVQFGSHYSKESRFRNGANLSPQPLVITESLIRRPADMVSFRTKDGKGKWRGELGARDGKVERKYVHPVAIAKRMVPFGILRPVYLIAPIQDGELIDITETGEDSDKMKIFWAEVSNAYKIGGDSHSAVTGTLLERINVMRAITTQLKLSDTPSLKAKVVYNASGNKLCSTVIPKNLMVDNTLYYYFAETEQEAHYLSSIFNAAALSQYFKEACRYSERDFHMAPVRNLPIPKYESHVRQFAYETIPCAFFSGSEIHLTCSYFSPSVPRIPHFANDFNKNFQAHAKASASV